MSDLQPMDVCARKSNRRHRRSSGRPHMALALSSQTDCDLNPLHTLWMSLNLSVARLTKCGSSHFTSHILDRYDCGLPTEHVVIGCLSISPPDRTPRQVNESLVSRNTVRGAHSRDSSAGFARRWKARQVAAIKDRVPKY